MPQSVRNPIFPPFSQDFPGDQGSGQASPGTGKELRFPPDPDRSLECPIWTQQRPNPPFTSGMEFWGATEWREFPPPLENPIFLLPPFLEAKIPQELHGSSQKNISWNTEGFSTLPGVTRRCPRCPLGVSHGFFSLFSTGLHPTSGSLPFSRIFPHSLPSLVVSTAPPWFLLLLHLWEPMVFQLEKGISSKNSHRDYFIRRFLQKKKKSFFGNSWGFAKSPLGRIMGVSNSRKKTFGAREFHSLTTSNGESLLPLPKTVLEGQKNRRIWEESPKSRREQGRKGHQEMPQPTDGVGLDGEDSGGIPARPACPAPNESHTRRTFPTIPSPPAPYSRDFCRESPPQPSAVPSGRG